MNETGNKTYKLYRYAVQDSEGKLHMVDAHYYGQHAATGTLNFFRTDRPNMRLTASFTNPVYVKEVYVVL